MNPTEKSHNTFRDAGPVRDVHAEATVAAEVLAALVPDSDEFVEPTLIIAEQRQLAALDDADEDQLEPVLERVFRQVDAIASEFLTADAIEDHLSTLKSAAALPPPPAAGYQHTRRHESVTATSPAHERCRTRANDPTDRIITGAPDPRPPQHDSGRPIPPCPPRDESPHPPITYFTSDTVVVTDRYLVLHQRRYAIGDLHQFAVTRGPCRASFGRAGGVGVAGMGVLAGTSFGPWPTVAAGFVLGALALVVVLLRWSNHRPYELWAQYQGLTVKVYACPDRRTFTHLCRALLLARGEPAGPATTGPDTGRHRTALGWTWRIATANGHLPLTATTGLIPEQALRL